MNYKILPSHKDEYLPSVKICCIFGIYPQKLNDDVAKHNIRQKSLNGKKLFSLQDFIDIYKGTIREFTEVNYVTGMKKTKNRNVDNCRIHVDNRDWLTMREAAEMMDLSKTTTWYLAKTKRLKSKRLEPKIVIPISEVRSYCKINQLPFDEEKLQNLLKNKALIDSVKYCKNEYNKGIDQRCSELTVSGTGELLHRSMSSIYIDIDCGSFPLRCGNYKYISISDIMKYSCDTERVINTAELIDILFRRFPNEVLSKDDLLLYMANPMVGSMRIRSRTQYFSEYEYSNIYHLSKSYIRNFIHKNHFDSFKVIKFGNYSIRYIEESEFHALIGTEPNHTLRQTYIDQKIKILELFSRYVSTLAQIGNLNFDKAVTMIEENRKFEEEMYK